MIASAARCCLVVALALMGGCDDEPATAPDGGPCPGEAWIELGTGNDPLAYSPLVDGQDVWIAYGLQGGYHIWGGFRGDGFDPDGVRMQFALHAGDQVIGGSDYTDDVRRGASGDYEYGGVTVFIFDDTSPESLEGTEVRMSLVLTDACGRQLDDARTVRAHCCE
ncbi:MAG: hypothetical protein KC620_11810 [Myxococcales bacterium]|nr:hypothetical protein [Myxococcales bacterium]